MTNRAMKDSGVEWIGAIPEDWEILKYKRFAKSGMGSTLLKEDVLITEEPNSVPIYSATQTDKHFGYLKNPKIVLEKGDLVIPARGNSIGNTKIIKEAIATCTQTTIYSKLNNKIDNRFLYYCSIGLKEYWFFFVQTAIPQITVAEVQNNLVPFTSMKEQQKIAAFLDEKVAHIDNIIEETKKSIENLKAYKQSLIAEAVTKGLNPDVEMKDSGIEWVGDIPKAWNVVKTKRIYQVVSGGTPSTKKRDYWENGLIPWITPKDMNNMINGEITLFSNTITQAGLRNSSANRIPKNSIILSSRAPVGKVAVNKFELTTNQGCKSLVKLTKEVNSSYYYYFFFISEEVLNAISTGTTFVELSANSLMNFELLFPPIHEQQKIANFLDEKTSAIDSIIEQKEQLITELEAYKKSLIYEYVTGKKEVE